MDPVAPPYGQNHAPCPLSILDEEQLDVLGQRREEETPPLWDSVKSVCRCSGPRFKSSFLSCVPVFSWLRRYSFREWAPGDLVSGISVGIMHLPQGLANALLAAVPPVYGLYSSFYPILVYCVFGSSQHVSVGTFSILAVMVSSVTEGVALPGNGTAGREVREDSVEGARVAVAAQLTLLSGLIQIVLSVLGGGGVSRWLSQPLVKGYTTAAAFHVLVHQLPFLTGIRVDRHSGFFSLGWTLVDILTRVSKSSPGTLVVSALSAAALIGGKMMNSRFKSRLPTPIPWELIVIILATVLSAHLNLAQKYSVQTIGRIPTGLSAPSLPPMQQFHELLAPALALAVVGFGFTVSLGKMFALKHGYRVDSNQELLALGLSNSIGGVFQCFAVSGSMSRSLVQESMGGKTQLAGALSSLVVLVVLLRLGAVFEQLPKAVLAVVVVVNLHGIFGQGGEVSSLWAADRLDLLVWVLTLVFTLLFNLDLGLVASIGFSLLTVIFRTQNPRCAVLGHIPETDCYRDCRLYSKAKRIPGVTIFSCSSALYFANADLYFSILREEVQQGRRRNAAVASEPLQGGAAGHRLILDLSAVAFMDSASVNTLRTTVKDMKEQGVTVCLAACPDALKCQLRGQLFDPALGLLIFPSVHHAVQHCGISTQPSERSTRPSGSGGDLWEQA